MRAPRPKDPAIPPRRPDAVTSPPMDAALTDDGGLMLAWAGGDPAAFTELYARHKGPLYRFLLKMVKDRALADELFQETWSRVIAARARYRAEAGAECELALSRTRTREQQSRHVGTGDRQQTIFSTQTLSNILQRMGVQVADLIRGQACVFQS